VTAFQFVVLGAAVAFAHQSVIAQTPPPSVPERVAALNQSCHQSFSMNDICILRIVIQPL
jgi:hypothetical protein